MPSAASRVVSIVELLEYILSFTEYGDLIKALRVSKQFNAVVLGSEVLRKAIWLENEGIEEVGLDSGRRTESFPS